MFLLKDVYLFLTAAVSVFFTRNSITKDALSDIFPFIVSMSV